MLSGCIALFVNSPGDCVYELPYTSGLNPYWEQMGPTSKASTKEEFLQERGKPDKIIFSSNNEETWVYTRKVWCGVIPVLILPIPLVLPVCDGFDRINFKDNVAKQLYTKQLVSRGYVFPEIKTTQNNPACRSPLNNSVGSDAAKPAEQVTP
jgi:hypothetical protein